MKTHHKFELTLAAITCLASISWSQVTIVNDTWQDGNRTDPASPVYSEYGTDGDLDTDLESAWFRGGAGTFDPVGAGGPLRLVQTTSSASLTTYFTAESAPVTLASAGDWLRVTWVFTPSGVIADNTSQGVRLAVVDSPSSARVTSDASPGTDAYSGYSIFMNMAPTLGNSNPFQLRERAGASGALLSSSGDWSSLANGATTGNDGYAAGTEYTFVMTLTRTAAGELDILATMSGGTLDGDGLASVSFLDTTPNNGSFAFDTFAWRPDGNDVSAETIDTTLFKVEVNIVPEPTTWALTGFGLLGLAMWRRRAKR